MKVEIVTPEEILFNGEVNAVSVPGVNGEFQMLENHAPIVSVLTKGYVKLYGNIELRESVASRFEKGDKKNEFLLAINGGTLELNNNRVVILAD
ncbi:MULTISPECIES: F0F1 ATP synthase subunit epsilon [Capnocytophaga]|uniref:F-ATPase epsilon subunit n=1 Tax=Capnocytophaga canis TaxID=1848903 RepID=A0A0B7IP40_9FLAO|nr:MULTISPECIES: ATP synthase subunit delta [Capnocytophaga]ATA72717.1 hypothetical protein CGC49_05050 [Capnocytophaga sp. H4358]RIY36255.1 hypothetical protein CKY20_07120 [Capnocytophaga canis]CEN44834.1 F-ATPase epsilon subunit [Capnocytophaga canis]CEN46928.1 F-ATPase epsilon subunit [Capnocytophaga canis]CEN53620.1 F-ATPase epsilon subunit [Capnocytophaga canis]